MFLYWAMMLSVSGMYTMYIAEVGFSKKEIGVTVTILTLSALIGQNVFGYFVDRFRRIKKILFLSISIGIIFAMLLMFAKSNWQVNILIFVWGFFIYGTVPLSEVWCIESLKAANELNNFGKIRGFGSIGYGFSGVLIGLLLQFFGWKIYYWYILLGVCLTLLSIYAVGEKKEATEFLETNKANRASKEISTKQAFNEIMRIKPLVSMIIIIFIYTFVIKGIYSYLGVLIGDYGGGPLSLGLTLFFDATPEVVTFFLTARLLRRFHSKRLIFVAFLLQILRLSLILVFNSALAVILLGPLSGFAYGLLASSYKTFMYELAPEKYKASCMSLCETIIGLSGVISAPIFGFIFAEFGGNAAITIGLVIYIVSALAILWDFNREKKVGKINSESQI